MSTAAQGEPETRRRRPAAKSIATRRRILATAVELFAERGYHATGVAELSEAVGLGPGALYHHIGSKEELLFEICRMTIEGVAEAAEQLADDHDRSAREKLRQLAREHMRNVAEHGPEMRVAAREINSLSDERCRQIQDLRARVDEAWEKVVSDGRQTGEFAGLDSLFVKVAIGALNSSLTWYRPGGSLSPDEIADRTIALLLGEASPAPAD